MITKSESEYPIPKVMVQEWTIRVVDESGAPLSGVMLTETWENYTFRVSGWDEFQRTNLDGIFVFPKKTVYRPVALWLLGALSNLRAGVHACLGDFATVYPRDARIGEGTQ